MSRLNEPLGLPKGSVRSLLVLSLVGGVELVLVAFALRVLVASPEEIVARSFEAVLAAVIALANLGVGYYFGTRTSAPA